eukprot:TRINITY_DN2010_c0_g1_i1.p1 TRINITY_DN2010_c0_g1~~TRINITY_DN2010_c0_g1_i1.p1  ORF type:complete len:546 (+),score=40.17 TRINITY_DN2010_c0_g1_i1:30-1667(+)
MQKRANIGRVCSSSCLSLCDLTGPQKLLSRQTRNKSIATNMNKCCNVNWAIPQDRHHIVKISIKKATIKYSENESSSSRTEVVKISAKLIMADSRGGKNKKEKKRLVLKSSYETKSGRLKNRRRSQQGRLNFKPRRKSSSYVNVQDFMDDSYHSPEPEFDGTAPPLPLAVNNSNSDLASNQMEQPVPQINSLTQLYLRLSEDLKKFKEDLKTELKAEWTKDLNELKEDLKTELKAEWTKDLKKFKEDLKTELKAEWTKDLNEFKEDFNTRFNTLHNDLVKTRAAQYEYHVLAWLPYKIYNWWNFKPDIVSNRDILPKDVGYNDAFNQAAVYFGQPNRQWFRDIHSAVSDGKTWKMFEQLEYNGLGSGLKRDFKTQVNFGSPNRTGSAADHNILVVAETTMKKLSPEQWIVEKWLGHWNEKSSSLNVLQTFKDTLEGLNKEEAGQIQVNYLTNLLAKLVQMEKQLTLQVFRFMTGQRDIVARQERVKELHQAMRAVLVGTSTPNEETQLRFFTASFVCKVFPHVCTLYALGNFKLHQYATNYSSFF